MKRRAGKAGAALIFGALSAIIGVVIGEAIKDKPLDLTKMGKKNGQDNMPA